MPDNFYGFNKMCKRCGQNKHASRFPRQVTQPGQKPICGDCWAEIRAEREKNEPDHPSD